MFVLTASPQELGGLLGTAVLVEPQGVVGLGCKDGLQRCACLQHSESIHPSAQSHGCFVCLFQTDGASAVLLMSEEKALAMGYKPKAYLR